MPNKSSSLASYQVRIVAHVIDLLMFWAILLGGCWYVIGNEERLVSATVWWQMLIGFFVPVIFIQVAHRPYFLHAFGGTVGKLVVGIRVQNHKTHELLSVGHAFFREYITKPVSLLIFYVGVWSRFNDPHHQTWHDELAGTEVVGTSQDEKVGLGILAVAGLLAVNGWLVYQLAMSLIAFFG